MGPLSKLQFVHPTGSDGQAHLWPPQAHDAMPVLSATDSKRYAGLSLKLDLDITSHRAYNFFSVQYSQLII